ncbi:hypothetical protein [Streptomyces lasiicapitis]
MTWLDVLLYGPGWLACALIPVNWWLDKKLRRKYDTRHRAPRKPLEGRQT